MSDKHNLVQVHRLISSYIAMEEREWLDYASHFRFKSYKKYDYLHQSACVCCNVFFINRGLVRVFFVDGKGEEHTFHFSLENQFVSDYESFLKGFPSRYSIQALEATDVVLMSRNMLQYGYANLKQGETLGRKLAEEYFFLFSEKIKSMYTQSPLERYNNMNSIFPSILQRVPQHYIASYLNVSSVHLSRLKNP